MTLRLVSKYFSLLALFLMLSSVSWAQLKIKGVIYSEGPIQASLSVETYPETHFLYLNTKNGVEWNGREVFRTRYDLPWDVVKDYNHVLKFTDGTVDKFVFIDGTVPQDIVPKQKLILDVDLTNEETADVMLVVFWSLPDAEYLAIPYTNLDLILSKCMDPSLYSSPGFLKLAKNN